MHSVACRVIYGLRLHSSTRSVVAMPRRYLSVQPSVKPAGVEVRGAAPPAALQPSPRHEA